MRKRALKKKARKKAKNPLWVGGVLVVLMAIVTYLGFVKDIPFVNEPYTIKAAFRDVSGMNLNTPVRIAGVEVGKVRSIEATSPGAKTVVAEFSILDKGRPIHADAKANIRPRIFLEGNFFIDLQPGTPGTPEMKAGDTIPVSRTGDPVQLDEVLKALRSDVRKELKSTLVSLGEFREAGGAKAFRSSLADQPGAYRWTAVVSEALLGERPGDLGRLVQDTGAVFQALDRNPAQLRSLVTNFNRTVRAIAESEGDLRETIRELPRTLRTAMPAFAELNAAFPPVRRFAREAQPAIRSITPTTRAVLPLLRQLRGLMSENELRGLARDLRRSTPALARLSRDTPPLLEEIRALAGCTTDVLVPFGNLRVPDPNFPVSGPIHQETGKALTNLAGESRSFDGNGQWFKVLGQGGVETFDLGNGLFGTAVNTVAGVNPPPDRSIPPFRPEVPCETQALPNLTTRPGAPPPQRRIDHGSPAVVERTKKARQVALALMQLNLLMGGDRQTKVVDQDATAADIRALAERTGLTKQLSEITKGATGG